mgnify:CR=1 FL=1
MTRLLVLLALVLSVASCGSVDVTHYADQQPALNLEHFFSQPVKAWGMFQKRSGEVVKRFEVDIVVFLFFLIFVAAAKFDEGLGLRGSGGGGGKFKKRY